MSSTRVKAESWFIFHCIMSEYKYSPFMGDNAFRAQNFRQRARDKILSWMSSTNVAKALINDNTASLLNNVYSLVRQYTKNNNDPEKLIKQIIKISIKIVVLRKNNVFTSDEVRMADCFKNKFLQASTIIMTIYDMKYNFDKSYLISALNDCQYCLLAMVTQHLTVKSLARIDSLFQFLMYRPFLNDVLHPNYEHRVVVGRIVADLNTFIEQGYLEID